LIGERLDNLIPWFLKQMLHNSHNITVEDEFDDTFCTFFVRDKLYFGVHGDKDVISDLGVSKLVLWAGVKPDCIITGHKHHAAMSEVQGIKVIQSGSLGGSGDEYTREKRLKGKASQTVIVVNEKGIKAVYPLEFDY
jgi:predicted phosphodiesterase